MSSIIKIIFEIIASIGGLGIFFVSLGKYMSGLIAKKIEQSDKYHYDRNLEQLKYELSISKDRDLERLRYELGISRERGELFYNRQFETYSKIWDSLFQLKIKGDLLWEELNSNRLEQFSEQLKKTKDEIGQYSLFIQEEDYEELTKILIEFSNFSDGKLRLWEIYNLRDVNNWQVESMISNNRTVKHRYNTLLEKIKYDIRHMIDVARNY